jgi:hypothetical protein
VGSLALMHVNVTDGLQFVLPDRVKMILKYSVALSPRANYTD